MDPETGCGVPSTGEKARLLIGRACWFWNSIGQILAVLLRALASMAQPPLQQCTVRVKTLQKLVCTMCNEIRSFIVFQWSESIRHRTFFPKLGAWHFRRYWMINDGCNKSYQVLLFFSLFILAWDNWNYLKRWLANICRQVSKEFIDCVVSVQGFI